MTQLHRSEIIVAPCVSAGLGNIFDPKRRRCDIFPLYIYYIAFELMNISLLRSSGSKKMISLPTAYAVGYNYFAPMELGMGGRSLQRRLESGMPREASGAP
jgi:hypothetical protein